MYEPRAVTKIEAQEEIDFINDIHAELADYLKRAALGSRNEDKRKLLTEQAPLRVFFSS